MPIPPSLFRLLPARVRGVFRRAGDVLVGIEGAAGALGDLLMDESADFVVQRRVPRVLATIKEKDPGIQKFFDQAPAYAVFPTVGKGGIGIGGAYGSGILIEGGRTVGETSVSQVTVGFQLGGQAYSEFVFFQDQTAVDDFKRGNFEFSAQASAVAVTAGASADAGYNGGVAIFTMAKGGLMYEASVGGQKFKFEPK